MSANILQIFEQFINYPLDLKINCDGLIEDIAAIALQSYSDRRPYSSCIAFNPKCK
jgi:hypothetical protein